MQTEIDRLKAFSFAPPHRPPRPQGVILHSTAVATTPPSTASAVIPRIVNSNSPPQASIPRLPQLPPTPSSIKKHQEQQQKLPLLRAPSTELSILTYLDLSGTPAALDIISTTGRLPKWIQQCSNLQYLIGEGLALTGIDEWVSESLLQLRVLRVPNNNIATWPDHLAKLLPFHNITVIDLEGNPCFTAFCERCPKFALEYSKAAGYISSSTFAKKAKALKSTARRSPSVRDGGRDSVVSISPTHSHVTAPKKKSSFFFSKSKKKKDTIIEEGASTSATPVSNFTRSFHTSYSDDDSDDDMLTSMAPITPSVVSRDSITSLTLDQSRSFSIQSTGSEQNPDKWAQKRIESTEIEKSRLILSLLRDVWELSTTNLIKPSPYSVLSIAKSMSSTSSTSNQQSATLSPITSYHSINSHPSHPRQGLSSKLKNSIHTRLNSLEVLEQYLDEETVDLDIPKVTPPNRAQIISLLTKLVESEKNYVARLGELMVIYVQSKKRPAKAAKLFVNLPAIYSLHSNVMLFTIQRCLDTYISRADPNLDKLADLFATHTDTLRLYIEYELAVEESMRLVQLWKRVAAMEANQPSMQYGAALPHLVFRHPDAYIAEWIQTCMTDKSHKLAGLGEYLQLPVERLEQYRYVLGTLQHITPELNDAYHGFEEICAEIDREKPKAAEQRRMVDFDQMYNLSTQLQTLSPSTASSPRRYLGDAVLLLKSEVRLELPSKTFKVPDAIHYMSGNDQYPSMPASPGQPGNGRLNKSNPVPKVLNQVVHKLKFTLPLFRVIVCDDIVILIDDEKKKVIKVLNQNQVSASLPWKFPVRDETDDALPTGEQASLKSKSSSFVGSSTGGSGSATSAASVGSGVIRLVFHDEPVVWYCALRTFTGNYGTNMSNSQKDARTRLVELFHRCA